MKKSDTKKTKEAIYLITGIVCIIFGFFIALKSVKINDYVVFGGMVILGIIIFLIGGFYFIPEYRKIKRRRRKIRENMNMWRRSGYDVDNPKKWNIEGQFYLEKLHSISSGGRPLIEMVIVDGDFNFIRYHQ